MQDRLCRFATAFVAFLLLAGCASLPPEQSTGPATSAVSSPAPSASRPTTTPLAPGEALPTLSPTAGVSGVQPTAAAPSPLMSSTRTGIPRVDRVIEAGLTGERGSLLPLLRLLTTPCTTREGLGGPPKCAAGETEGTPVEVFPVGGPEGTFVRRGEIDRLLDVPIRGLFAVYAVPPDAYREPYWPAGDFGIVFLRPDNTFLVALVDSDGIVRLDYPAVGSAAELSQNLAGTFVLPPAGP